MILTLIVLILIDRLHAMAPSPQRLATSLYVLHVVAIEDSAAGVRSARADEDFRVGRTTSMDELKRELGL